MCICLGSSCKVPILEFSAEAGDLVILRAFLIDALPLCRRTRISPVEGALHPERELLILDMHIIGQMG